MDRSLIARNPHLWMGELPHHWSDVAEPVVVNLCGQLPQGMPARGQTVHVFPLVDIQDPEILPARADLEKLLDEVHGSIGDKASYWHCHAGINRSGFAVAAYLHRHRGQRISAAIATLRENRSPMVLCNALFEATLRAWYGGPEEQHFEPVSFERWVRERMGGRLTFLG
jgi:hypothetical protein